MKATAIILAGGKNLRLGRNKAAETIGGKSIIERVIERVSPLADQILIVSSAERTEFKGIGKAEVLADLYPGGGPLGGIYTGLVKAKAEYSVAVACDMPFLNTRLLGYMLEQAAGFDAVVPLIDGGLMEPLHSVYAQSAIEKMKAFIDKKQLSLIPVIKRLNVRYIQPEESRRFDPKLLSFFNINYPRDVERAIAIEAEGNS